MRKPIENQCHLKKDLNCAAQSESCFSDMLDVWRWDLSKDLSIAPKKQPANQLIAPQIWNRIKMK